MIKRPKSQVPEIVDIVIGTSLWRAVNQAYDYHWQECADRGDIRLTHATHQSLSNLYGFGIQYRSKGGGDIWRQLVIRNPEKFTMFLLKWVR